MASSVAPGTEAIGTNAMMDWLRRRHERRQRDADEANRMILRFGSEALIESELRAQLGSDARSRRHWMRVARVVRSMLDAAKPDR